MNKHSIILWGSVSLFIIASIVGLVLFGGEPVGVQTHASTTPPASISASDWLQGDITAKVNIIEYSDFQCPACGTYFPILQRLKKRFGSQVGFVYRHFPLSIAHKNAIPAAMAAEAAGLQGKFWEMHDLLFEKQGDWSTVPNTKDIFVSYARDLKLDEKKFISDLGSTILQNKISASYDEGTSIGINGTPTIFINGQRLPKLLSYDEFEREISKKLSE